jgi:divalent metal cation (Fe/Co/Zn/Cd) transporter
MSEPGAPERTEDFHRPDVRSAFTVSMQSVVWTVVSSGLAVTLGIRSNTAVLVAFGAIGIVDAIGSIALAYHFRHGLRHDALSERLEKISHRIVLIGLFAVGCAAVIGGVLRLLFPQTSDTSVIEVALAATSFVALVGLSVRKRRVGRRIDSAALMSDGQLSAVGAVQAAVTLAGIAITRSLGWRWADAVATVVVGCVASWLAISTWRSEHHQPVKRPLATTLPLASGS